jgi:hypothetical protein
VLVLVLRLKALLVETPPLWLLDSLLVVRLTLQLLDALLLVVVVLPVQGLCLCQFPAVWLRRARWGSRTRCFRS